MTEPLSLFILAGEPSGDRIGAALVGGLRERAELRLTGVGGTELMGQGIKPLFPMSDLSVMGYADVLKRLPKLFWRLGQVGRAILSQQPDVVVLIDSQVFSATLARRLRAKGYRGKIVLYVAPSVWAWKPERAPALRPLFDEVLSVLPFETTVMQRLGGPPTTYVGHPALQRLPFRLALPERGPLLLLPGSRLGEIDRTLPMMRAVAAGLVGHPRVSDLVLPTPHALHQRMTAAVADWTARPEVVSDEGGRNRAFGTAVAAVAVSGTVTLELALAGVPMVTTYVGDTGQAKRFAKYKVKFVGLPNIILDRAVMPELLFTVPDADRLTAATQTLLDDRTASADQVEDFAAMRELMEKGAPEAPLVNPVDRVLAVAGRP